MGQAVHTHATPVMEMDIVTMLWDASVSATH